jgi:hypothetical protein
MRGNWKGYEQRFERERLVIGAGEEKVGFGGGYGAGNEWYYGGVGNMERCVDREHVGRVFLKASDWRMLIRVCGMSEGYSR